MGPVQRILACCVVIVPLVAYIQVRGVTSLGRWVSSGLVPVDEDHHRSNGRGGKNNNKKKRPASTLRAASGGTSSSVTGFSEECYLMEHGEKPKKYNKDKVKLDPNTLGRCRHLYPARVTPKGGYLKGIDFFHFRETHGERDRCFLYCVDQLDKDEINTALLVQAVKMGLTKVVRKLKNKYGLDPLHHPSLGPEHGHKPGFNAVQEAIRGGHVETLKYLIDSDTDLVIDGLGRTVGDYIRMRGSAIRPKDAMDFLSVATTLHQKGVSGSVVRAPDMGWNRTSKIKVIEQCDIDVVEGFMSRETFYNDYFMTGRPFVLRGMTPESELQAFSKPRWSNTDRFHPSTKVRVGPTAYPSLTDQRHCKREMTITQVENATECKEMPGLPMVHVRHPNDKDLKELYPMYDGDLYDRNGGWRKLEHFFGPKPWEYKPAWQVFFGGDGSGATLHSHNAAFNILYSGIKQWKLTPPRYRGRTGMPAFLATEKMEEELDESISLVCTQRPGDIAYIPDYWGHLTLNAGFAIGAAVILKDDYQMTADAKPRILFVHINKNGGSSVIKMLQNRCDGQYTSEQWGNGHRTFHATAHAQIDHYGQEAWDDAYSFAVVRHPLARQVSNFFFLLGRCNKKFASYCKGRKIPLGVDLKTDEEKIEAFHKSIWDLYNEYPPGSKKSYLFGGWGHGNEEYKTMNATQTSWMVDEQGEMVVKNVFKLENLSQDMKELNEAMPCLKHATADQATGRELKMTEAFGDEDDGGDGRLEMVHANASPDYPDFRLFGKNKRTNRIMKEVYYYDYINFGYDFEP